jgi:DNA-binding response OmpR family regulator
VTVGSLQRILYVEDDADIRKIVSMSLEMVGEYTVAACGSCADAMQVVDDFAPDLLLLDVMMPGVDGPSTLDVIVKPFDPMALSDRVGRIWQQYRGSEYDDAG